MTDVRWSRSARMFDDPDLGGDLLLVGLGFARFLDFGTPPGQKLSTALVANAVYPSDRRRHWRVKHCIADDARTYRPPQRFEEGRPCGAPMIRREGLCGKAATSWKLITDWATGEQSWVLACRRHVHWYDAVVQANRESKPEKVPLPAANHGGLLARHIPEFAWPQIWVWATDEQWVEHPEVEPWRPPTLTLHLGEGETGDAARPMLGVVTTR